MNTSDLKQWRSKHRMTQQELADIIGVAKNTIYRWEAGMREIPPFLALALRCVEREGGEKEMKGAKMKKERKVKRIGKKR
jgi:DNA-binding XRE family transcriptional regulator